MKIIRNAVNLRILFTKTRSSNLISDAKDTTVLSHSSPISPWRLKVSSIRPLRSFQYISRILTCKSTSSKKINTVRA